MSAFNWFMTEKQAYALRTVEITTADGNTTYTARTGRVVDNFVIDRVIDVTTTSTFDLVITLPNGVFIGQQLLVVFKAEGGTDQIDVDVDKGDDSTPLTAVGGWTIMLWTGSTNGWVEMAAHAGE